MMGEIKTLLLCSLVINYSLLLIWFGLFCLAHQSLYRLHSRWFKLSVETFDMLHYVGMAIYKVGVLIPTIKNGQIKKRGIDKTGFQIALGLKSHWSNVA